jgi:retinol dehydrogenase-13
MSAPAARGSLSRRHEALLLIACALCLFPPLRAYAGGGVCAPALLQRDLAGKVFVITGATAGIGFETAAALAARRATIVFGARDASRGAAAAAAIRARAGGAADVTSLPLDLASFASVRAFAAAVAAAHPRVDALVANAGVMLAPKATTVDGHDLTMQTNHFSHFLLCEALAPALLAAAPSRIVVLSSSAAHFGAVNFSDLNWVSRDYGYGIKNYAASKLANALHARELAKRWAGAGGVTAVSVDPGAVDTELQRHVAVGGAPVGDWLKLVFWPLLKTPWQGAQTTLHALLADDVPAHAGEFFADAAPHAVYSSGFNDANAEKLWQESLAAVAA